MRFGPVSLDAAEGAILAHSQATPSGRVKKGARLGTAEIAALRDAGLTEVVAATLADGDLTEDEAAGRIGAALALGGLRAGPATTGRVNLFAEAAGLFLADRAQVDAVNAVDDAITLATLPDHASVDEGRMVATVKIIPLAVPGASVARVLAVLGEGPAFRLAPFRPRGVALVQTELATVKPSVLDKTRAVTEARLAASGSRIVCERRCAHERDALAAMLFLPEVAAADLVLVFGASAVIDAADVIPAAIEAAGGSVAHLGMPVDPGNLLLLGEIDGRPVLGAPGCARSPKENGFDWVLDRLLADRPVLGDDIRRMGVGGLLMEIASRPQPREAGEADDEPGGGEGRIDIVLLAAGRSSRMGGTNKLLQTFGGEPLVRRSARTALDALGRLGERGGTLRIVTGASRAEIAAALEGVEAERLDNPDAAAGLSTSLKLGFSASVAAGAAGVLVMLADQPLLTAEDLLTLADAFEPVGEGSIVVATDRGRRANPVILSGRFAPLVAALSGDVGARDIVAGHRDLVREVELGTAAGLDVDTPQAMDEALALFETGADR
ncbi:molybdopterin-binding/glycosyltransferase family 2 protein [Aurantimonas sp. Leaf443]|uniref:NTP transferase domain-containing protein n=1 Tax=Aurantimonas sp. Leaf443 TaxID=1736378 RepID=UPI0006F929C0|nr:molybdopterin-binding/glycosyltransferase family 2 protein [Aurantimonas sp. Leaf443]KQT86273.1 4-diphosphocytidyl-2C-methyl-D-erythritol kinase [Aurantimonas sp. Leaf443]